MRYITIMLIAVSMFAFSDQMHKMTGVEADTLWIKNGATIDTALVINGDLTVSGTITGDITGDVTGKADSAVYADTATYATAALDADTSAYSAVAGILSIMDSLTSAAAGSLGIAWKYETPDTLFDWR